MWTSPEEPTPSPAAPTLLTLGGFLPEPDSTTVPPGSTARSSRDILDKLAADESVPIDLLSQFEVASPEAPPALTHSEVTHLREQYGHVCETLPDTENALRLSKEEVTHQKTIHTTEVDTLQSQVDDLQVQVTKSVTTLGHKRSFNRRPTGAWIPESNRLPRRC